MAAWWSKKKEAPEAPEQTAPEPKAKPASVPKAPKRPKGSRKWGVVPLDVRLACIEAVEAGLGRDEVAELAGVSASSVDSWHRAYRAEGLEGLVRTMATRGTRQTCEAITSRVVAHREAHPEQGVRRVRDELRRSEGLAVSAETVRQIVNDEGLGNAPPASKRRPPQIRRFERPTPNAMWQIDIFTFELKRQYPVYLVGIIDDHSRYLVGHGLYRQQTADAVMEVVKGAIGQWGAPREILSDNGRQFVAWRGKTKFQKTLTRQGVQHVRSAPHHPMTLGKIERFWKTLWTEFLEDAVFASFADACQRLDHWIAYYNHQRPHQGIGGACPADRFYGVSGDVEEAVRQGCADNALRLALGQVPEPPLFLLGKLGETDIRVARKGDTVEVRLGDGVHEVIRLGQAKTVDEVGAAGDDDAEDGDAVEGAQRRGAVPDRGDGPEGGGAAEGDLRDLRRLPPEPAPRDDDGGRGGHRGARAEVSRPQAPEHRGPGALRPAGPDGRDGEGAHALEDEVRDREGLLGAGAQVRPGGAGGLSALFDTQKNRAIRAPEREATPTEPSGEDDDALSFFEELCSYWAETDDGDST